MRIYIVVLLKLDRVIWTSQRNNKNKENWQHVVLTISSTPGSLYVYILNIYMSLKSLRPHVRSRESC